MSSRILCNCNLLSQSQKSPTSPDNVTCFTDQSTESATPAQHRPTDGKRPEGSQKIETTLFLLVEGLGVLSPVQLIVYMATQILMVLNSAHIDPLDGNMDHRILGPPQVHNQFMVFVTLSCR